MRRFFLFVAAIVAAGCSSHSLLPQQSITPQVGDVRVPPGWTVTKLPKIGGQNAETTGMAVDLNHKLWVVAANYLGVGEVYKVAMDKHITKYPLKLSPSTGSPLDFGPDQNLWIAGAGIAQVTTKGVETDFAITQGMFASGVITGSDGNLWFPECSQDGSSGGIGTMTTSGAYTFYPSVCARVIANGPDGNIWYGDKGQNVANGGVDVNCPA
jgi:streptogramin lyase